MSLENPVEQYIRNRVNALNDSSKIAEPTIEETPEIDQTIKNRFVATFGIDEFYKERNSKPVVMSSDHVTALINFEDLNEVLGKKTWNGYDYSDIVYKIGKSTVDLKQVAKALKVLNVRKDHVSIFALSDENGPVAIEANNQMILIAPKIQD